MALGEHFKARRQSHIAIPWRLRSSGNCHKHVYEAQLRGLLDIQVLRVEHEQKTVVVVEKQASHGILTLPHCSEATWQLFRCLIRTRLVSTSPSTVLRVSPLLTCTHRSKVKGRITHNGKNISKTIHDMTTAIGTATYLRKTHTPRVDPPNLFPKSFPLLSFTHHSHRPACL